jgi:4-hydroxybenzoate polyprenyltransferase/phosphoserine phosphatase
MTKPEVVDPADAARTDHSPPRAPQAGEAPVLVIDLDGTLCLTDTLHENLIALLARRPLALPGLVGALLRGKAAFKRRVAEAHVTPGHALPYNEEVLELARRARAEGRRVVLVSASDQAQVDAVAAHLGLFDEAFGTGGPGVEGNLGGRSKAAFLIARYGRGGFDYVADGRVDLPVWSAARRAITAGARPSLRRLLDEAHGDTLHLGPSGGRMAALMRALRPHQWSKNVLVFLPMLAAHELGALPTALAAFVAFCLTASSVYLLNDLVDLEADRAHPRKRLRPFASGRLPVAWGIVLAPALLAAAALIALVWTPPAFLAILFAYYAVTFAYSFWLKRKALIDVMTLAGLYTVRIVAGAAATALPLSPWMLGFSMFLFLALAAVKRQAELAQQAEGRRTAGRGYETSDLPLLREMAVASGFAAVLVFALYISSEDVLRLYARPEVLWLICPLLLYWLGRMVLMTHRGHMDDDPIVFAARDWPSRLTVLFAVAIVLGAGVWP